MTIRFGQFVNTPGSNGVVSSTVSRFKPSQQGEFDRDATLDNSQTASFDCSSRNVVTHGNNEPLPFEPAQMDANQGNDFSNIAHDDGGNIMHTMMSMMMQMMQMMMGLMTQISGGSLPGGGNNQDASQDGSADPNPGDPIGNDNSQIPGHHCGCGPSTGTDNDIPEPEPEPGSPTPGPTPNPVEPDDDTPPVDEPEPDTPPADQTQTATPDIDRNINFHNLSKEDRTKQGLNNEDRAILHLWGRQVISRGFQDGSIQMNVEQNPNNFTQAERDLVKQLTEQDKKDYGGITGKTLDNKFFALMQKMHPEQKIDTSRWLDTEPKFAKEPLNIISDKGQLTEQTGLSEFDQGVLRLWGHDPLFNGGKSDGAILAYTIGNENALDNAANAGNKNPGDMNIDNIAQGLLDADFASDGVRDGDSLQFAFGRVLDKMYLGGTSDTMEAVKKNADTKAKASGRTPEQVAKDVSKGVQQAMKDVTKLVKDHPVMATVGVGGLAAASAICPFMGGLAVGGAGLAAGSKFLKGKGSQDD